jgi:hypothetical protein
MMREPVPPPDYVPPVTQSNEDDIHSAYKKDIEDIFVGNGKAWFHFLWVGWAIAIIAMCIAGPEANEAHATAARIAVGYSILIVPLSIATFIFLRKKRIGDRDQKIADQHTRIKEEASAARLQHEQAVKQYKERLAEYNLLEQRYSAAQQKQKRLRDIWKNSFYCRMCGKCWRNSEVFKNDFIDR